MDISSKTSALRLLQVVLIAIIILIIYPFLIPIALAFVFAALLWPFAQKEWRFVRSKALRAFLLTTGFTFLIVAPVLTLIGAGVFVLQKKIQGGALEQLDLQPGHYMRQILSNDLVAQAQEAMNISDDKVTATLISVLQKGQVVVVDFLQSILTSVPQAVLAFLIMVICLFWILKDQDQIAAWLFRHSPWNKKETMDLIETFRGASVAVVMAGILSGAAQAIIIGIGAAVSGLGNPSVAATIVFFASFFPFLGSGLVSLSLIGLGLVTGQFDAVIYFLPFAGISSVADNVIYPLVVGGRGEMNPLISFLAVIGGIQLFGIFGIFLGPITLILCLRTLALLSGDPLPTPKPRDARSLGIRVRASLPAWALRGKRGS